MRCGEHMRTKHALHKHVAVLVQQCIAGYQRDWLLKVLRGSAATSSVDQLFSWQHSKMWKQTLHALRGNSPDAWQFADDMLLILQLGSCGVTVGFMCVA